MWTALVALLSAPFIIFLIVLILGACITAGVIEYRRSKYDFWKDEN
jgi:hypothetical protein